MLNQPHGVYVHTNLDWYVADRYNDRIQLFPFGQSDGITVAGNTSSILTIDLNNPNAIILDANKYVFIVDHYNHHIIGSGVYGFRCLVGCSGVGSPNIQLLYPHGQLVLTQVVKSIWFDNKFL